MLSWVKGFERLQTTSAMPNARIAIFSVLIFAAVAAGCRSRVPSTVPGATLSLPAGEVEVIIPCSRAEFAATTDVFRANAVGESIDQMVARKKAIFNACSQLAANVETTVRSVTESYINSRDGTRDEEVDERFESFSRQVVHQQLRGMRIICERFTQTPQGRYKAYIAVELSAQHLADAYYERLKSSRQLNSEEDADEFMEMFDEEIRK